MEVTAFRGQGVFGAGRDFSEAATSDDAVSFEVVQTLAQGARIDSTDGMLQFAEAFGPVEQVAQDERSPFIADDLHGGGDAADFGFEWFAKRG